MPTTATAATASARERADHPTMRRSVPDATGRARPAGTVRHPSAIITP
jgi:hypothetical protein